MIPQPTPPREFQAILNTYPDNARQVFMQVRQIMHQITAENPKIGPLSEVLKWGEPAFVTEASKSGSTIRMVWDPEAPEKMGLFFNCKTTLVENMRHIYRDKFEYEDNRGVFFALNEKIPVNAIAHICEMAMAYHLKKPS